MISTMAKLRSVANQEKKSKTKEVCLLNTRREQTYGSRGILRGGRGVFPPKKIPNSPPNLKIAKKYLGGGRSISPMNFLHELFLHKREKCSIVYNITQYLIFTNKIILVSRWNIS